MKKLTFTKLMLIAILAIMPLTFYGQTEGTGNKETTVKRNNRSDFKNYLYFTGDGGITFLYGDNDVNNLSWNAHFGLGYQFDPVLGLKLNLGYGVLDGEKKDSYKIDYADYCEANINLTISFTDMILGYKPNRKFNVTPHVGIGTLHYRTKVTDKEGNIEYNGYHYNNKGEGINFRKVILSVPMGLELRFQFNPRFGLYLDYTANYTDTDLLDGIILKEEHKDWFNTLNLGAVYKLKPYAFKNLLCESKYCNYWFLTMDGGVTALFADNSSKFLDLRNNFNIGVGYHFHHFLSVYGKLGYGVLEGERKNDFTLEYCDYYAANLNLSFDLINIIFGYNGNRVIELSPHIGFGQIQYRARAIDAAGTVQMGGSENEDYQGYKYEYKKGNGIANRRVVLTVPMGVELTYNMNSKWDFYLDGTTNYCNSEFIDCYDRGDHEDWYTTFNLGFRYKFKNSCVRAQKEMDNECCMTPEEVKQALKEALDEAEKNKPKETNTITVTKTDTIKTAVIYHNNYTSINFPVGKSEKIKTQTNSDAINRTVSDINDGFKIKSTMIESYSSPEGTKEINDRLSKERGEETAKFISQEIGISTNEIQITSKGSDWEGLINAIKGSNINKKDEIVNKIKNSSNREETLRSLINQYPQIKSLLPQLRRAEVTITTVK